MLINVGTCKASSLDLKCTLKSFFIGAAVYISSSYFAVYFSSRGGMFCVDHKYANKFTAI